MKYTVMHRNCRCNCYIFKQPDQKPSMGVYEAWQKGYTGKGIVVGLISAGIDTTHSDLIESYVSFHFCKGFRGILCNMKLYFINFALLHDVPPRNKLYK